MDFHLDRALKLNVSAEHKNLYSWAIVEADDAGQQIGIDQIPWGWTLHFKATEFSVSESLRIATRDLRGGDQADEITKRSVIRVNLTPGHPKDDEQGRAGEPTYRMFSTDRLIRDFRLDIVPITSDDESENCTAWGSASYTSEIDFRHETTSDLINFYLFVRQERFDRYVWNIAQGLADDMILSVGHVDGFYSEWSPSISTNEVKVLTSGEEHRVEMPGLIGFEMPRLGKVGQAEFFMNARRVIRAPDVDSDSAQQTDDGKAGGDSRSGFRWPSRR